MQEECKNRPENQRKPTPILHPAPVSYTLSFTHNSLKTLRFSPMGVGNVGDLRKTFFKRFTGGCCRQLPCRFSTTSQRFYQKAIFPDFLFLSFPEVCFLHSQFSSLNFRKGRELYQEERPFLPVYRFGQQVRIRSSPRVSCEFCAGCQSCRFSRLSGRYCWVMKWSG